MPKITVVLEEGDRILEIPQGTRLVWGLEKNGIDVSHRCGGYAKCTTCQCEISIGAPNKMTEAEKAKDPQGFRLSCQILVEGDMTVKPLKRVKDMEWNDPGKTIESFITPDPKWIML